HITNGMYGLAEPEGGLPQVDREFYVMQGELYTAKRFGMPGHQEMDYEKLISERPEYFLFNGRCAYSLASAGRTSPPPSTSLASYLATSPKVPALEPCRLQGCRPSPYRLAARPSSTSGRPAGALRLGGPCIVEARTRSRRIPARRWTF